jgi:hypothetical protein
MRRQSPSTFLVTGISASGKSTVGALLARRFARAAFLDGDVFYDMVVSGRVSMVPDPPAEALAQLRLRYRQSVATIESFREAGFTVVAADIVIGDLLTEYLAWLRSEPVHLVVLAPDVETVTRREAGRHTTAYGPGSWDAAGLDALMRAETPWLGLWFDNSRLTPEETVDAILAQADAARVPLS